MKGIQSILESHNLRPQFPLHKKVVGSKLRILRQLHNQRLFDSFHLQFHISRHIQANRHIRIPLEEHRKVRSVSYLRIQPMGHRDPTLYYIQCIQEGRKEVLPSRFYILKGQELLLMVHNPLAFLKLLFLLLHHM